MFLRSTCKLCNQQFLENERRWKIFTIPVFTIITTLALATYPIEIDTIWIHTLFILSIILALWISNRFIIVQFHHRYKNDRIKKKKIILKYLLSIGVSLVIVIISSGFYHDYCTSMLGHANPAENAITHRMLYLITILFVYFINANYERMFLFVELTEKAIEAETYKKDSVEKKFQNLKDKINPHFLFNTFTALSETIEEDPPKASGLVQELADVYRYVLDNQESNWVPLKKELEFAHAYVNLLKMRFEESLQEKFSISDQFLHSYIAPLSIQLLIENAVKHNIISSKKKLTLDLFMPLSN
mgnify:CR=1 FL=1